MRQAAWHTMAAVTVPAAGQLACRESQTCTFRKGISKPAESRKWPPGGSVPGYHKLAIQGARMLRSLARVGGSLTKRVEGASPAVSPAAATMQSALSGRTELVARDGV